MKLGSGFKIFIFFMLYTQLTYAKSPCYKLATTAFFESSISPTVASPQSLKDANAEMADGETLCKRLVQAVKTKKTSSDVLRSKAVDMLKEAKNDFEHDGDMDKLELIKYQYELVVGAARISEEKP